MREFLLFVEFFPLKLKSEKIVLDMKIVSASRRTERRFSSYRCPLVSLLFSTR